MNKKLMFSSASIIWETPQKLFNELNDKFNFETDVCALSENAKCTNYYTPEIDGLKQNWCGVCWMNPPYGKTIGLWVKKAYDSAMSDPSCKIVALLPARTDTRYFHDCIYNRENIKITFLKGRLKFSNSKLAAPFPSMIVEFN